MNTAAVLALLSAIVGVIPWLFLGSVAALFLSRQARREIALSHEKGHGLAVAAAVIAWVNLGLWALLLAYATISCGSGGGCLEM